MPFGYIWQLSFNPKMLLHFFIGFFMTQYHDILKPNQSTVKYFFAKVNIVAKLINWLVMRVGSYSLFLQYIFKVVQVLTYHLWAKGPINSTHLVKYQQLNQFI